MKKGFTLIELIFVIVIIGVLASIALPRFNDTRQKAISNTIKQDITTITRAIKSAHLLNGDITNINDVVEVDTNIWKLNTTQLKLEYKISNTTCVTIEVDKITATHKLKVTIDETTSEICQIIANDGIVNSSENLN
jgi:general secretion pathway protein G